MLSPQFYLRENIYNRGSSFGGFHPQPPIGGSSSCTGAAIRPMSDRVSSFPAEFNFHGRYRGPPQAPAMQIARSLVCSPSRYRRYHRHRQFTMPSAHPMHVYVL